MPIGSESAVSDEVSRSSTNDVSMMSADVSVSESPAPPPAPVVVKKRLGRPPKIKKIEPKSLDETLISDSELDLHSPEASHDGVDHSTTRDEDMNLDEDFEIHPQHSILASTDTSRQFIKRPLNAYMIWTRHARDGILKSNPHLKMNEVSKTMGEMWKKLQDEEKKPFFAMARKAAAKHKKALELNPKLAYVPSKKKIKKVDKNAEEHKDEDKDRPSPYPTPSASPAARAHIIPQQTDNRAHAPYPANGTVVRPTQYQTTPYPQGYDYRQPVQNGYPYPAAQYPQGVQPVRYVQHSYGYPQNGGAPAQYQQFNPPPQGAYGHIIQNPRDPHQNLVRNPFAISYTESNDPVYEPESAELYKELYYKSLVQLQYPGSKQYGSPEVLEPEFYLNRYYALGGTDPPRRQAPIKGATNNSNGLVYQEL